MFKVVVHEISNAMKSLHPRDRGCRMKSELPEDANEMFQEYHEDQCIYEKALAQTIKNINCVPFNYLHPEPGIPMCTRNYVASFQANFTENIDKSTAGCPR